MINISLKKIFQKEEDPIVRQMAEWAEICKRTQDIYRLQQYKRQRVFVADGVMDDLLREGSFPPRPVWPQCYTHDNYTLWKKDLGIHSYSVILPQNYRPTGFVRFPVEPARIQGNLWAVYPDTFISLDNHREHGVKFVRQRVRINLPWRYVSHTPKLKLPEISKDFLFSLDAWVYLGIPEYWDPMIGGIFAGSQLEVSEHMYPREGKFYQFKQPPFE